MNTKNTLYLTTVSLVAVSSALIAPAFAQDRGGLVTGFSVQSQLEATRNPTLTSGNNDIRTTLNSDLQFSLKSETRRSQFEAVATGSLRYTFDGATTSDEGFDLGDQGLILRYATKAPRATFDSYARYAKDDLSFISAADLIDANDGTITVADDFINITGSGTRENISYRLRAQFDETRPFGWGTTVSGSVLNYSDVTGSTLTDSSTYNAALDAHFDVKPTVRIDTRLLYSQRDQDGTATTSTTTLSVGATAVRSDDFSVQALLSYALPDTTGDRVSITGGFTLKPYATSELTMSVGAALSDDFDPQLIGRLSYDVQLTSTANFNLGLNTNVTDSIDNDVVVNTAALMGADFELTPLSSLSFDAVFAQQSVIATDTDETELSTNVQLNRQLTRDWQVSVGASSTTRWVTGEDSARSEAVFVNFGRSWNGRF